MQSIILAAGKSTRTYPLTLTRPKPLLKAANKTILEYNIESLENISDEIIIMVGYKKEMIKKIAEEKFPRLNIKFVEQKEQLGTGHAVSILESHIEDRFLLLMGDNIYSKKDVDEIAKHRYSILAKEVKTPELFGVIKEKNGLVLDITEKPKNPESNLISCALYSFDKKIFELLKKVKKSERNEYEITDSINDLISKNKVRCVHSSSCLQISYPWDLLEADKEIRKNKTIIGKYSKIPGNVENSSIGNNCKISGNVKNSIVMDNSIIEEGSIIEDSIIGENVYFKGKIKSTGNAISLIKGIPISAGRLGAIIGDNVKAENVNIKAGCKIWPNKKIKGEIAHDIRQDLLR